MTDLNNKHLPSDINSLTRKDLVEIYDIHAEEFRKLLAEVKSLEEEKRRLIIARNEKGELNAKLQQANDEAQSLIGLLEIEVKKLKQDCRDLRIEVSMLTSSVGGKSYKQLMRQREQRDLEQQAKGVKDLKALLNGADWEDSELQMYLYHHIEDMKLKQVSELSK